MAYQPTPNDPYRAGPSDDEFRRQARLSSFDSELQPDPELAEGRASGAKVAMFAIVIALVLGAVFYSLNNTTVNRAGTSETAKTAQTQPATPPGMRDVTPKANSDSGMTTGAAPSRPETPATPANPDMSKTAPPPADGAPAAK